MVIEDILFPKKCLGCGSVGSYICRECGSGLARASSICPVCFSESEGGYTHDLCRGEDTLDRLVAPYRYGGVLRKAIKRVKYSSSFSVMDDVFSLFLNDINLNGSPALVTNVPMHDRKRRVRGFDQARILSELLANSFNLKYLPLLKRDRETSVMYELGKEERGENIRDSFSYVKGNMRGRKKKGGVVLVDDVWTTGSTMRECCRVLKGVGFKAVWGVVVAR